MELQDFIKVLLETAQDEFVAIITRENNSLILTFPDRTQIQVSVQSI